jgi:hypothetical protein
MMRIVIGAGILACALSYALLPSARPAMVRGLAAGDILGLRHAFVQRDNGGRR